MDVVITFSIVAIAALWAVARLRSRFVGKKPPSCAGCTVSCNAPCDRAPLAGIVLAAFAFVAPLPLFAQQPRIIAEIDKVKAAVETVSGISVGGFFDMQAAGPVGDRTFTMGDFELDLARNFGKNTQVSLALVANGDGTSVATGFVDFQVKNSFRVQVGRFDVPFGNDWQYLASKDRTESSAPLTTDLMMDGGFNDAGVRVLGNSRNVNYTAFVLRGDGEGRILGGRLGFARVVGVSMLRNERADVTFLALDSEAEIGRLLLRTEYVQKQEAAFKSDGWHVTAGFDAGRVRMMSFTPFVRYDSFDESDRVTAGLNTAISGAVLVKVEYQRMLLVPGHSVVAHVVMIF